MAQIPKYPHVPGSKGKLSLQGDYLLGKSPREEAEPKDIQDAENLIKQAMNELESKRSGKYDSALWRLVDAAGIISKYTPQYGVIGKDTPTGRGFRVIYS